MSEKSIFNFKIQRLDGTIVDLHDDKNIWVSSFRIFSPLAEFHTERIDGRHGTLLLDTTLQERKVQAKFSVEAKTPVELDLIRDDLFMLFNPLNQFYIIRDLQPNKRMKVTVDGSFNLEYLSLEDGEFDLGFIIHSTFLESVNTTLNPSQFDGYFQMSTPEQIEYQFSTGTFKVWNEGNIIVDPRAHTISITFKGSSNILKIKNITTSEEWLYNGTTTTEDIITLDGIRSFKNGISIFGDTNKKLITLVPGWNEFEITGATEPFEISFDFRFYYL